MNKKRQFNELIFKSKDNLGDRILPVLEQIPIALEYGPIDAPFLGTLNNAVSVTR